MEHIQLIHRAEYKTPVGQFAGKVGRIADYHEMLAEQPEAEHRVGLGADPFIAIRRQGYWDEAGLLERSNILSAGSKAEEIENNSRRLRA